MSETRAPYDTGAPTPVDTLLTEAEYAALPTYTILGGSDTSEPALYAQPVTLWQDVAKAQDAKTAAHYGEQVRELRDALRAITKSYVDLVNTGDCGSWDPETEPEVIAARRLAGEGTKGE